MSADDENPRVRTLFLNIRTKLKILTIRACSTYDHKIR